MKVPTVHMNGTAGADLVAQLEAAIESLHETIDVVGNTAPNARDYYVQEPGAFAVAQAEHVARIIKLQAVRAELAAIWEGVEAQS